MFNSINIEILQSYMNLFKENTFTEEQFVEFFNALRDFENRNKLHTIIEYAFTAIDQFYISNHDSNDVIKAALNIINDKTLAKLGFDSSWFNKYCEKENDPEQIKYEPFYMRGLGNTDCEEFLYIISWDAQRHADDCSSEYVTMLNDFFDSFYNFFPNVKGFESTCIDCYLRKYPQVTREQAKDDFMKCLANSMELIEHFFIALHTQVNHICSTIAELLAFDKSKVFFAPYKYFESECYPRNFLVSFPKPNFWTTRADTISCSCITRENQDHFNFTHYGFLFAPMPRQIIGMGPCDVSSSFFYFNRFDFGRLVAACCSFQPFLNKEQALRVQDPDFKPFIAINELNCMTLKSSDKYNEIIISGFTEPVGIFAFRDKINENCKYDLYAVCLVFQLPLVLFNNGEVEVIKLKELPEFFGFSYEDSGDIPIIDHRKFKD